GLARSQMCFCQRGWFTDEIMQFTGHSRELVRHSIWNDDDLAFGNLVLLAAFNFGAANFMWRNFLGIDGFSSSDQRGRSIDDINDVGIERMDLGLAGFDSPAGVHFVTSRFQERHTLGKGS